ncbi:MAG TPA: alpha-amylase/4-alpha-glucanotransferase domain-containing protein [candidate division Zixibacteria bacterium]|nr:alpha-amylase/4-alpha-glucanotransferase domain-containing protein [candidate division Zixibacteria bacterium]
MPHSLYFAIHNHQPVGNFDSVIDDAFEKAYLPFLRLVKKFPTFKFALHNSGILYEWAEKRKPEFFKLIEDLLAQKQLELLGGGFYEPILPSIPKVDRIGQILKMSDYLEKRFGARPKGLWVTERVWEPNLPKVLAETGIEFTMLDDTLFRYSGYDGSLTVGPLLTEDEGRLVYVFPILKELRYKIPFAPVEEVAHRLFAQPENPKSWVYADDGEKFGAWPKTFEHCYTNGWVERFLAEITAHSNSLETKFFSEALAGHKSAALIYLPTAAYEEMLEWALPPKLQVQYEEVKEQIKQAGHWEKAAPFFRGGFWRNFLTKYPEVNQMHKKMLFVSGRLQTLKKKSKTVRREWKEAQDLLYKGQCNCPYWHGVFGGAYLTHLRAANYEALIGAQNVIYELENKQPVVTVEEIDFNADGQHEIIIETPTIFCVLNPHQGGCITELDFKPKRFNLQNTFTSYPEAYHKKLMGAGPSSSEVATIHARIETKEEDLEKYLPRGGAPIHPNCSFREHIDGHPLHIAYARKLERRETSAVVLLRGIEPTDLLIEKRMALSASRPRLRFEYRLENIGAQKRDAKFVSEFNFNFEAPFSPDRYFKINGQKPSRPTLENEDHVGNVTSVEMVDEWRKVAAAFRFEQPVSFERHPIFTVSLSEGGAEKTYQGSKLLFGYPIQLKGKQSIELNFSLELLSLSL